MVTFFWDRLNYAFLLVLSKIACRTDNKLCTYICMHVPNKNFPSRNFE